VAVQPESGTESEEAPKTGRVPRWVMIAALALGE
jgi:hypothetical protein